MLRAFNYFLLLSLLISFNLIAALPETIAKVKPSVVGVGSYRPTASPRGNLAGSGFVVAPGVVATNAHVLKEQLISEQNESHAVFIANGRKSQVVKARLIAIDKHHDLALLKVDAISLDPLALDSAQVREGQELAFTGFPVGSILGLYHATHLGIVSAITPVVIPVRNASELTIEQLRQLRHPYMVYQLDAKAFPGNSGSPVFDPDSGAVVAIINKVLVKGMRENALTNPTDITYAIPVSHLQALMQQSGVN